jgi:hypothetical protein
MHLGATCKEAFAIVRPLCEEFADKIARVTSGMKYWYLLWKIGTETDLSFSRILAVVNRIMVQTP